MSFFKTLFGRKAHVNSSVTLLTPAEFRLQVEQASVQLIDVRTPIEYKAGHIKGAKNIDFFSGKFNVEFDKLYKDEPIYLYCRSGSRSRQTAKKLDVKGFTKIYDLKGGILNYK